MITKTDKKRPTISEFLGKDYLSPSSLNKWSGEYGDEAIWCLSYLFGVKFTGSAATIRGEVVESAFEEILTNQDTDFLSNCKKRFVQKINELKEKQGDAFDRSKAEKEYKALPGFIESAHTALEEVKFPPINETKNGKFFSTQSEIKHDFGPDHELPLYGKKDFSWPDFSLDLKTSHRLSRQGVPVDYACQISGYAVADGQREAKILTLSPKDYTFYVLRDMEIDVAYKRLKMKAKQLENRINAAIDLSMIRGTDPKREMANLVTPGLTGFKWGDEELHFIKENNLWQD